MTSLRRHVPTGIEFSMLCANSKGSGRTARTLGLVVAIAGRNSLTAAVHLRTVINANRRASRRGSNKKNLI